MSEEIVIVGDAHAGCDPEGVKERLRQLAVTLDFANLEKNALNFMIMGDMVDGPMLDVIECTEYRDVTEEPLLLPPPEGRDE